MKTIVFGVDGHAPTRQFLELLGWQVMEEPSLSHAVIQLAFLQTDTVIPGQILSDPPCLGCKFLKVRIVSQDILRHCTSLVSAG